MGNSSFVKPTSVTCDMWLFVLLPFYFPSFAYPWSILNQVYNFQSLAHRGQKCPLVISDTTNSLTPAIYSTSDYNPATFLQLPHLSLDQKKWLPHCETVVISFDESSDLLNISYSNKNYHIFYGKTLQIKLLFAVEATRKLKFKLGVSSDSGNVEGGGNFSSSSIRNSHLRISVWKLDPWYADVPNAKGQLVPYGVHYNMLPTACRIYNFTYTLKVQPPRFHMLPNGTWVGVMHDLQAGFADLVISLGPTPDRLTVSTPGTIMYAIELAFMLKIPTPSVNWTAFLLPFTWTVWICTMATTITVATLGWIFLTISRSIKEPINHALVGAYSALLGQSGMNIPRVSVGAEVLFSTWLFSSIVITTYYCSDLLAAITIPQAQQVPLNFKQLAARQDYNLELWYFGGSLSDRYFTTSTNPLYVEANKRMKRVGSGPACTKQAGTQDKVACISFNTLLDSMMAAVDFTQDEVQHVLQVSDGTYTVYSTVLYEKNSKYFDDFDRMIGQVRDAGLFERWIKLFFAMRKHQNFVKRLGNSTNSAKSAAKSFRKKDILDSRTKPFTVKLLLVPFEALIFGLGLSIVVFLVVERKFHNQLSCNNVRELSTSLPLA